MQSLLQLNVLVIKCFRSFNIYTFMQDKINLKIIQRKVNQSSLSLYFYSLHRFYKDGKIPKKLYDGIVWKPWLGPNYSMKKIILAVRPFEIDEP